MGMVKTYEIALQAGGAISSPASEPESESESPPLNIEPPAAVPVGESPEVPASAHSQVAASSAAPVSREGQAPSASSSSAVSVAASSRSSERTVPSRQPVSAASSDPGRFAVQVGSFSSQDKAQQIAANLRSLGVSASVTPVKVGSKTLYRVRSGSVQGRAAAESALRKVRASYPEASIVTA